MGKHWFAEHIEKLEEQGLEQFGRYYSIYRAFVHDVDDPENLNRIMVVLPDLTDEHVYPKWIFPRGLYAGRTSEGEIFGIQNLPSVGDLVFITFEMGDIDSPLWEHGYKGEDEVIGDPELQDTQAHWFRSPGGHTFAISDTTESITITHKNGQAVLINKDGISLISEKAISLGTKDKSAEPGVLGDKNEDVLNKLQKVLSDISNALATDVANAGTSGMLMPIQLAIAMPQAIADLAKIPPLIPQTKSKLVTLD